MEESFQSKRVRDTTERIPLTAEQERATSEGIYAALCDYPALREDDESIIALGNQFSDRKDLAEAFVGGYSGVVINLREGKTSVATIEQLIQVVCKMNKRQAVELFVLQIRTGIFG